MLNNPKIKTHAETQSVKSSGTIKPSYSILEISNTVIIDIRVRTHTVLIKDRQNFEELVIPKQ